MYEVLTPITLVQDTGYITFCQNIVHDEFMLWDSVGEELY